MIHKSNRTYTPSTPPSPSPSPSPTTKTDPMSISKPTFIGSSISPTPLPLPLPPPPILHSNSPPPISIPTRPPRKSRNLININTYQVQRPGNGSTSSQTSEVKVKALVQAQSPFQNQVLSQYAHHDTRPRPMSIIHGQNLNRDKDTRYPGQVRMSTSNIGPGPNRGPGIGEQTEGGGEAGGSGGQRQGQVTGGISDIHNHRHQHRHRRTKSSTNVTADLALRINDLDLNNLQKLQSVQNIVKIDLSDPGTGNCRNVNVGARGGHISGRRRGRCNNTKVLDLSINLNREDGNQDGNELDDGGSDRKLSMDARRQMSRSTSISIGKCEEKCGVERMVDVEMQTSISRSVKFQEQEREFREGDRLGYQTSARLRLQQNRPGIISGLTSGSPSPSITPTGISTSKNLSHSASPCNSPSYARKQNHPNSYHHHRYYYNTTSSSNSSLKLRSPNLSLNPNQNSIIFPLQQCRSSSPFSTSLNKTYPYHGYPRDKAPKPEPEPKPECKLQLEQMQMNRGCGSTSSSPKCWQGEGIASSTLLPHFEIFKISSLRSNPSRLRSRSRSRRSRSRSRSRSQSGTSDQIYQGAPAQGIYQLQPNGTKNEALEKENEREKPDVKGKSKAKYGLGFGVGFGTGFTSAVRGIHNTQAMRVNTAVTTIGSPDSSIISMSMISTCSTWSAISLSESILNSELDVRNSSVRGGIKNETDINASEETIKPKHLNPRSRRRYHRNSSSSSSIPGGGYTKLELVRTNGSGSSEGNQINSISEFGNSMRHSNGTTLLEKTKLRLKIGQRKNFGSSGSDGNNGNGGRLFGLVGKKYERGSDICSGLGRHTVHREGDNASGGKMDNSSHVDDKIEETWVGNVESASAGYKGVNTAERELLEELDLHLKFDILNSRNRRDAFILDDSSHYPSYLTGAHSRSNAVDKEALVGISETDRLNVNLNTEFDDTWLDTFKFSFDTSQSSVSRELMGGKLKGREKCDVDKKMIPLVENQFEGLRPRTPRLTLPDFPNLKLELSREPTTDKSERRESASTSAGGGVVIATNATLTVPHIPIRRTNSTANWSKALPSLEGRPTGNEEALRDVNLNLDLDLGFDFGKAVLALAAGEVHFVSC